MIVARCSCKQEFESIAGEGLFDLRDRLLREGWRYGKDRWHCLECHNKFMASKLKRKVAS